MLLEGERGGGIPGVQIPAVLSLLFFLSWLEVATDFGIGSAFCCLLVAGERSRRGGGRLIIQGGAWQADEDDSN